MSQYFAFSYKKKVTKGLFFFIIFVYGKCLLWCWILRTTEWLWLWFCTLIWMCSLIYNKWLLPSYFNESIETTQELLVWISLKKKTKPKQTPWFRQNAFRITFWLIYTINHIFHELWFSESYYTYLYTMAFIYLIKFTKSSLTKMRWIKI